MGYKVYYKIPKDKRYVYYSKKVYKTQNEAQERIKQEQNSDKKVAKHAVPSMKYQLINTKYKIVKTAPVKRKSSGMPMHNPFAMMPFGKKGMRW